MERLGARAGAGLRRGVLGFDLGEPLFHDGAEPGAFFRARRGEPGQRVFEARDQRGHALVPRFLGFIFLRHRFQHTGQRQQVFQLDRRCRRPAFQPVDKFQHLAQHVFVDAHGLTAFRALQIQMHREIAACEAFGRLAAPMRFEIVIARRQAESEIQIAAVDAFDLPGPAIAVLAALGSGEARHGIYAGGFCHYTSSGSGNLGQIRGYLYGIPTPGQCARAFDFAGQVMLK